jgi:poly(A) polymerase
MIRLLKFQARFGFEIDSEARIALLECRHEIAKSSSARILEELLRMLESGAAQAFFKLIAEHGLLQQMLPLLAHSIESADGDEIYSYLQEVDTTFHEPPSPLLERPILISCLLWPLLQRRIQSRYLDREKMPHLGEIQNETHDLIDEVFHPFFHLPRRLRMSIVSLLTAQYRLTPIEKKRIGRLRIPSDPDFHLALKFLEIRCCQEPALQMIWQDWNAAFTSPNRALYQRKKRKRRPSSSKEKKPE